MAEREHYYTREEEMRLGMLNRASAKLLPDLNDNMPRRRWTH